MGSHKNTLLQKLALLGLVTTVGIGTGTHVVGQVAAPGGISGYEAELEQARTLAEMISVNPNSQAAQRALIRLRGVLAAMPPAVAAGVIAELAATGSLSPEVVAAVAQELQDLPLASVIAEQPQPYQ